MQYELCLLRALDAATTPSGVECDNLSNPCKATLLTLCQ